MTHQCCSCIKVSQKRCPVSLLLGCSLKMSDSNTVNVLRRNGSAVQAPLVRGSPRQEGEKAPLDVRSLRSLLNATQGDVIILSREPHVWKPVVLDDAESESESDALFAPGDTVIVEVVPCGTPFAEFLNDLGSSETALSVRTRSGLIKRTLALALNVAVPVASLLALWYTTHDLLATCVGYLAIHAALTALAGPYVRGLEVMGLQPVSVLLALLLVFMAKLSLAHPKPILGALSLIGALLVAFFT